MKKKNVILSISLILLFVIFTVLVKYVDVNTIGLSKTKVGLSSLNNFVFEKTGVNMFWYHFTDILGVIPILMVLGYALFGLYELIKRKSIFEVDNELIKLGVFYVIVIALYFLFEKFIINYRPVLLEGALEASYPSSHTMMSIFICGSFVMVNNRLFSNKKVFKLLNLISIIVLLLIVVGRVISGVHWFTDIIGGVIISSALLMSFYTILDLKNTKKS